MNEYDEAANADESAGAQGGPDGRDVPQAPPAAPEGRGWGLPPDRYPSQPTGQSAWGARPAYQPGPPPAAPDAAPQQPSPAGEQPAWERPSEPYGAPAYGAPAAPASPAYGSPAYGSSGYGTSGSSPYGVQPPYGGGGQPPYGPAGWGYGTPGGDPWGRGQHDPDGANRATRRSRRRRASVAAATAGVLAVAAGGVLIGHAAWQTPTTRAAASAPTSSGTGSSSGGSSTGLGSGSTGLGSGSTGLGSGSTGENPFGSGSTGSGSSGSTSSSATSSIAAGGPAASKAIASKVDGDLVDIDTTLSYQDEAAAGTGMVLTSDGEILTNNHVIDGATSIKVTDIGNGKTYAAKVVGYDRTQDVAVLQLVGASGLKTVTLGNSSSVKTAEQVVGVGNAGGAGGTPTYAGGVVKGLDKSITASDEGGGNSENLTGLIQTNAGIEPGDSGGPLLTTSGQVIGMDTAASSGTEFQAATTTTSFAIPINQAMSIARQIEAGTSSSVVHIGSTALLGVEVEDSSSAGSSSAFGSSEGLGTGSTVSGAEIAGVVSGSPAAKAGLAEGDVITAVDGTNVSSASSLTNALADDKPGDTVRVTVETASGETGTVSVTLTSGPPQ